MRALTIDTRVSIDASIERVWRILTDFRAYPDWNPYLVRVDGEAAAGAVLAVHAVNAPGKPAMAQTAAIVEIAPYAMRWSGGLPDRSQFRGDHWFVLTVMPGHTELHHFEHFSGSLAPDILARHGASIEANFERFNAALKIRAEAPETSA
jgi:hypothetical protein